MAGGRPALAQRSSRRAPELYFDSVESDQDEFLVARARRPHRGRCVLRIAGRRAGLRALAIISAYVLAGELARAQGRRDEAFRNYEALLRSYIVEKQRGAERFAAAFAPRTAWGLALPQSGDQGVRHPGTGAVRGRRDIFDKLQLPEYDWRTPGELSS